jgi:Leucine-rich repeat (LRR) protein
MKRDFKVTEVRPLIILVVVCIALPLVIDFLYSVNDEINDFIRFRLFPERTNRKLLKVVPLAGLTSLRRLHLTDTQVSDIRPLTELKNLHTLSLRGTHVSDLRPLEGLTKLKQLYIRGAQLDDEQIAQLQNALPRLRIDRL